MVRLTDNADHKITHRKLMSQDKKISLYLSHYISTRFLTFYSIYHTSCNKRSMQNGPFQNQPAISKLYKMVHLKSPYKMGYLIWHIKWSISYRTIWSISYRLYDIDYIIYSMSLTAIIDCYHDTD